jgi:6-phosphogluconolactonase
MIQDNARPGSKGVVDVTVYPDHRSFVDGAAAFIAGLAVESIAARGRFTLALSGGSTPRPIYARLAAADHVARRYGRIDGRIDDRIDDRIDERIDDRIDDRIEGRIEGRIDWGKVHIFFSDERCVPPDDAASNYRTAREVLLDHVPLPPGNIHRIRGEADPVQAALACEQDLQSVFRTSSVPTFDLICLGMGDDGHTASLFPGTAALRERERWVVAQYVAAARAWRVTFTAVLINAARHVAFLVEGAGKSETLRRVLEGAYQPDVLPAQLIQPISGVAHWLMDAAAAASIQST